jgi:hypothetical protein
MVPIVAYYALVHMGQQGLVFVYLPVLLLLGALGAARLCQMTRWRAAMVVSMAAALVVNAGIFCLAPEYPLGGERFRLWTRATLVNNDRYYQDRFDAVRLNLVPASTAILAARWHHVEYYVPEYVLLPYSLGSKWEVNEGRPADSIKEMAATAADLGLQLDDQGKAHVVVFDPPLEDFDASADPARELDLAHGGTLSYHVLREDQVFRYRDGRFEVAER